MKRMALIAVTLIVPAIAFAQQASPAAEKPPQGLDANDVQVLKEAVNALQDSFATQSGAAPASPAPAATPAAQKNMAEVADKVVDLGARAIAQAAGTVEKVAPEVWRIMIRQQYAKAAGLLTVPGGLFVICLFAWFRTRTLRTRLSDKAHHFQDSSSEPWAVVGGYIAPLAGMLVFGIWFLNRLADSIMYLFNPEYYAFRDLLVMILNKGQGL